MAVSLKREGEFMFMNALLFYINCVLLLAYMGDFVGSLLVIESIQAFSFELSLRPALTLKLIYINVALL